MFSPFLSTQFFLPPPPSFSTAQRFLVSSPQWWPTWLCVLFFLKFVAYGECLLAKQIVSSSARRELSFPLDVSLEHKTSQMQAALNKKARPLFQSFNVWFTLALWFFCSSLTYKGWGTQVALTPRTKGAYCASRKSLNVRGGDLSKVSF